MLALSTDYYPIRPHKVFYRRALSQKLGIGGNIKATRAGQILTDNPLYQATRTYRNRTFGHNHLVSVHHSAQGRSNLLHVCQVRPPLVIRRRTDGDKHHQRLLDPLLNVRGEGNSPVARVFVNKLGQPRLENGNLSVLKHVDL